MGITRGRCRAEVAADRASVADLRRANSPGRHRQARQPVAKLVDEARVGHAGADSQDAVGRSPLRELANPGEIEDGRRTPVVEVDLDHDVGSAGDRSRFRVGGLHVERLGPGGRLKEFHHQARPGSGASSRITVPSIRPYGRSAA